MRFLNEQEYFIPITYVHNIAECDEPSRYHALLAHLLTLLRGTMETYCISEYMCDWQVKCGMLLNVVGTAVITLASHTWGHTFFNLAALPWQPVDMLNATTIAS